MKKQFAAITLAVLSTVPASAFACSFNYSIYAAESISKRITAQIGKYVTNEYCQKYNKEYQIVIIAQGYMTETLSVGHSIVGLRKRGSNVYPANARSGFRSKEGNHAVSVSFDLAAQTAMDNLIDVMSDMDGNLN